MKNKNKYLYILLMAFALCSCIVAVTAWASGQIQITGIDVTQDGYLQITRNGNEPMTVWVRYPGQAAWTPVGKNITAATWVSPVTGEVAQIRIKPYTTADDVDFPPDNPAADPMSEDDPSFISDDPTGGDALFPAGDNPSDAGDLFPAGDDPDDEDVSFPAGNGSEFFASDTPPKNNQAKATPGAGTSQLIWRGFDYVASWHIYDWSVASNFSIRSYDTYRLPGGDENVKLDSSWSFGGTAALDADGEQNDYIWHHPTGGHFALWHVGVDPQIESYDFIQYEVTPGSGEWTNVNLKTPWEIVGIASLQDDTLLNDVIWRYQPSGYVAVWNVASNGCVTSYKLLQYQDTNGEWVNANMDRTWIIGAIADLDGDGTRNDVIWHRPASGHFAYWTINTNAQIETYGVLQYEAEIGSGDWIDVSLRSPWTIQGVASLDGDGKLNDVIWRYENAAGSYLAAWNVESQPSGPYKVTSYGLIQHKPNPEVDVWQNTVLSPAWQLCGIVAMDADGYLDDLIWHHPSSGSFACWRMKNSAEANAVRRIEDYGVFTLNGENIILKKPWTIVGVRQ